MPTRMMAASRWATQGNALVAGSSRPAECRTESRARRPCHFQSSVRTLARISFWCLAFLALQGCASRGGRIYLESTTNHRFFTQAFNQAYVTDSGSGEYDIVLV